MSTRYGYFLSSEEHPPQELVRQAKLGSTPARFSRGCERGERTRSGRSDASADRLSAGITGRHEGLARWWS